MIPVLYEPVTSASGTGGRTNGLGRLTDCVSAIVTEQRNGAFELELTMPVSGAHFSDIQLGSTIKAKPNPTANSQLFDVYAIEKTMDGMMATVRCQHVSYRLNKIPVLPFTESNGAIWTLLHFTQSDYVPDWFGATKFNFGTDVTRAGTYKQTVPASIRNRLLGEQGSVLQVFQGEYEWNNFSVYLCAARGSDRGVSIRYGKNLTSIEQDENIENTLTGILPYWTGMNGNTEDVYWLPEKILYADNAEDFPFYRTAVIDMSGEFEEKPTEAQLRAAGQKYIEDNNIGVPLVSFDVTAETLEKALDYDGKAIAERISLCDTVTIIFPEFNVSAKAKVIETTYDVLKERYISFKIGDKRATLATTIAQQTEQIQESEAKQENFFLQALEQATAVLNGDLTGAAMITQTDANGNPVGLIFMDTNDPDTAVNCIQINSNGIGFSNQGVGGPYSSTWDITNTFNAGAINVINLSAAAITTGSITDAAGRNVWNLDTSTMSLGNGTFTVDASGNVTASNLTMSGGKIVLDTTYSGSTATSGYISIGTSNYYTFISDRSLVIGKPQTSGVYVGGLDYRADGSLYVYNPYDVTDYIVANGQTARIQMIKDGASTYIGPSNIILGLPSSATVSTEATGTIYSGPIYANGLVSGGNGRFKTRLELRDTNNVIRGLITDASGVQVYGSNTNWYTTLEYYRLIIRENNVMRVQLSSAGLYFYDTYGNITKSYSAT